MEIRTSHTGLDRDSVLTRRGARAFNLTLQYRIQLVRCEPTTHVNEFAVSRISCTGNGVLRDGRRQFHLDRWDNAEWLSLVLVDTAAQAHQRYFIIKPRETNFRPFANAQRRLGLFTHRDLAMRPRIWLTPIDGAMHNVKFQQSGPA